MEPPKTQESATTGAGDSHQPKRTLFVRSLPTSATTDSLTEHFSESYVIKHAIVVTDSETKQSKGFGFVTFADIEDAQRALEEFNGSVFDGKKIKVDYAEARHREVDENLGKSAPTAAALESKKKREEEKASTLPPKLIVRNLPWSIKEPEDLAVHFKSFGKVKQATLPKRGLVLAGFGFIVMRGKKNAEKALEAVNGKEVDGRTLAVDWAVEKSVWEDLQKQERKKDGDEEKEPKSSDVKMAEDPEGGLEAASEDEAFSEDGEDDEEREDDDDIDDIDDMEMDDEDEGEAEKDEKAEKEKEDDRNDCTVFIRNLPFTATDDSLYEHFTQFGRLRYARIVVDPETERPRGTGFVCFWSLDDVISCVRDAPKQQDTPQTEKDKAKGKKASAIKHSVLQNDSADPSGRYTMDGRVLQIARAVSKTQAAKLEEEGVSRRLVRDTDKRRLFLLSEGTIPSNSALYKKLSPSEIHMREDSLKQRQNFIKKNPTLHLSLTRLSIRNVPRHITSKDLKALARQAVVGFAEEVKQGLRQPLSKEEVHRSPEAMKEAEQFRKRKGLGIVRQAKIVFEGREGAKIEEKSGAGRSRGYGFIEYFTHRHALMGLRWLNGHAVPAPTTGGTEEVDKKKRVIVEFAIENAQVVKRREELQARVRNLPKGDKKGEQSEAPDESNGKPSQAGNKRKRDDSRGNDKGKGDNKNKRVDNKGGDKNRRVDPAKGVNTSKGVQQPKASDGDSKEANNVAKRNRVIAKKRMQRRGRKA